MSKQMEKRLTVRLPVDLYEEAMIFARSMDAFGVNFSDVIRTLLYEKKRDREEREETAKNVHSISKAKKPAKA